MVNAVMKRKYKSTAKSLFQLGIVVLVGAAIAFGFFKASSFRNQQAIAEKQGTIDEINVQLQKLGEETRYNKLDLARKIEQEHSDMPWSDRISTIIEVLKELQNATYEGSNSINLYDFTVTLDSMTLKGEVTNIALLYHSSQSRNYVSLIDKFKALDFVEEISIQKYEKEGKVIAFTLDAKLSLNNDSK